MGERQGCGEISRSNTRKAKATRWEGVSTKFRAALEARPFGGRGAAVNGGSRGPWFPTENRRCGSLGAGWGWDGPTKKKRREFYAAHCTA